MKKFNSLLLSEAYFDSWSYFQQSISNNKRYQNWDYVVLTASNEEQATVFESQISLRLKKKLLPRKTKYLVIPDENGKRIGSGGSTLLVLEKIAQLRNSNDFSNIKILLIHSGGDSKRVPQYSALGKLFSPVPRELPDGRPSTLFDELLISTMPLCGKIKDGALILSGDVLLLFDSSQFSCSNIDAAALSFKEDVNTGKNHGVFLEGDNNFVSRFLHKETVETLNKMGAVDNNNDVNIDTGALYFSSNLLNSLNSINTKDNRGVLINEETRISLYGDIVYPLAKESTLENYLKEKAENVINDKLIAARYVIWNAIGRYNLKLNKFKPSKFVHFGTSREILELLNNSISNYSYIGWKRSVSSVNKYKSISAYNSVVSSKKIGNGAYIESSYIHSKGTIGENSIISFTDIHDEVIPSNVILHTLKQKDGTFVVRILGVNDNPKESLLFGESLESLNIANVALWDADIYPVCKTIKEGIKHAINIYNLVQGKGDFSYWKNSAKKSLKSSFNDSDPVALLDWDERMKDLIIIKKIVERISNNSLDYSECLLNKKTLSKIQKQWIKEHCCEYGNNQLMRLYYYLSSHLTGNDKIKYNSEYLKCIKRMVISEKPLFNDGLTIANNEVFVNLPLRINFAGGWTDTPPYCNENGGVVLNTAVRVKGTKPIHASLTKLDKKVIVLNSKDLNSHLETTDISELQITGNPYDNFALQKAVLIACGVIPEKGGNLESILNRLGSGFEFNIAVDNIPKGSGLGTSSILSAACVKAVYEFFGIKHTNEDIYYSVLCVEQIMSTGGGWQDQIGGLYEGLKIITSNPGNQQNLSIETINLSEKTLNELNERLCLVYTGQRRLARNILRDVIGNYISGKEQSLVALETIKKISFEMTDALKNDNVDVFASLLSKHLDYSKMIDAQTTNQLIDKIFESINDFVVGKMVCGAGGGGFLQIVLKKGVSMSDVNNRLKEIFPESEIAAWDVTIE